LQELLKRLQDRHVECAQAVAKKAVFDSQPAVAASSPDAPKVLQAMIQLEQAKNRAKTRVFEAPEMVSHCVSSSYQ
jgi:hypothetical protein